MLATPARKEVQELQFKLLTQLRLFSSEQNIKLDNPTNLVATASKYGLIFVGNPSGITCIQTSSIVAIQNHRTHNRGYIQSFPRRELKLEVLPSHIAVSCDNELLAATITVDNCPLLLLYSVTAFGSAKINTQCEVRMSSTPGVYVVDLQWNPGVANVIGAVLSDGSAFVYEFKNSTPTISSIPPNAQASCLCWSPKGKQVVIGAKNGTLTQYKPDLKAVKTFPPPHIVNQPEVVSVHWLSSFQFIAAYKDRVDTSSKPAVVVVNVPKGASPSFVNYEDICFGFGTNRPEYFFIHQQLWSVIIIGTSNGTEIAVLNQNGESWEQWLQDESTRAQLPVSEDYQDVYLTGMTIDYSPQAPVPIGENNFINPMPFLIMYSQEGVLCFFHVINLIPNCPVLCHAPQPLPDQSGMHLFTIIQAEQSKEVQEVEVLNSSGQEKPTDTSKQEAHFKLSSFESDLPSQPNKEHQVPATLASQTNFSLLNFPKQNQPQPQIPEASQGNLTSIGGFGMMLQNSSSSSALVPKFSTTTPLIPQIPPTKSTLTLGIPSATAAQVSSVQTNSLMPVMDQQTQNNRGLVNTFQFTTSSSSIVPQFSLPTTEISTGNKGTAAKPLIPSLQMNNSLSIIPQGVLIPTLKQPTKENTLFKEAASKEDNAITELKETEPSQLKQAPVKDGDEKKQPEIEVDFIGAIKEEVSNFNEEITNLEQLRNSLNFSVGHEAINDLVAKINDLKAFEKDVKETTVAQEAEVSALVNSVVEMFSWLENVKTKQKQLNNPRYMDLMESQDLDPVTKKHINNIEQYIFYLDTQIKQANLQMDTLWAQHKGKPIKTFELPNMEAIYQTIVSENYILAAQKVRVTELEVRLKDKLKTFSRRIPQLTEFASTSSKPSSDIELDVLADKLLLSKLNQDDGIDSTSLKENGDKSIMMNWSQKYLSPKKESQLHKWHKTHVVINAKSPKRESGQIDLSKYSKVVKSSSPTRNLSQNILLAEQKTGTQARSIFTITNQASFSSNALHTTEIMANQDEHLKENNMTFMPKSDMNIGLEIKSSNSEVVHKNKSDYELKDIANSNILLVGNLSQLEKSFSNSWNSKPISQSTLVCTSQDETVPKNNVVDTNLTNQISSFNVTSSGNNNILNSKILQPSFHFETTFAFKTPQPLTSSKNLFSSDSSPANFSVALPDPSAAITDTSPEAKEYFRRENAETVPETAKEGIKVETTTNSGSMTLKEKQVSTIFGTPASQNVLPGLNFSKSTVFPNVNSAASVSNTTGLKTTSLFGASLASSNTTSTAPTSIFGGKPVTTLSPQYINSVTTSGPIITSAPVTSTTVKLVTTTSNPSVSVTTPTFFTKPSAMKSLFGSVQPSSTNVSTSPSLFKISPSPAGTTIFNSGQQLFTTVSNTSVPPTMKPETVVAGFSTPTSSVPTITSSPATSAALKLISVTSNAPVTPTAPTFGTTPVSSSTPGVNNAIISSVISSTSGSLTYSSSSTTTALETNTSNVLASSPTNFIVSTAPAVSPSVSVTSVSNIVTEKDNTTPTTASLGITSPGSSVFGAKTSAQTISGFDTAVSTSSTATPKTFRNLGTAVGTSSESTSIFGSPVSKPSIFGNQSTSPAFGTNCATTTTTTTSIFPTTTTSIFPTTTTFVFGSPTTKTTTASIFGTPPSSTFGASTTNSTAFGAASALSSTSFFGTPATTATFQSPNSSLFSPPASTSSSSFFGQSICSPTSTVTNAFNNISFGQKLAPVTTSASVFGANRPSFENKTVFGTSGGGGLFGQTTSSPGTFGLSGGSLFGSASTFGSPQQQTNLFQSSTGTSGNLFSNSGGGAFTGGNQSVAQTGFGTLPNFQSGPRPFGSSSPVFGSQSSFGASPTFGGSATFGSPNKAFGSPTAGTTSFGTPTQQSSTFENLAGQNTLSFGNLAQGQQGFNSSPNFGVGSNQQNPFPQTSSFGGSSFSTWR